MGTFEVNGALQAPVAGIQEQVAELASALNIERAARMNLEAQLQAQQQSCLRDVAACRDMCVASELALAEERYARQTSQAQLQEQVKQLADSFTAFKGQSEAALAGERRQRQEMDANFQAQLQAQLQALKEERQQREQMDSQVDAQLHEVMTQMETLKIRLGRLEAPQEDPIKAAVRAIESHGHLRVSHETGHVTLLQPLDFKPRTTKEEPVAEFRDNRMADAICRDLAEISRIFNCPMTIEGHTKGGEGEFWQTLANERSRIVAEKMIQFGANPSFLNTRGLPGRLGKNEVRTEIYMDIRTVPRSAIP